jgi:citrate lyase subunit beta/citryl-CoA lyase
MPARPEDLGVRSLLFTPADAPSKLMRALESEADAIILDLEDSVESRAKDGARRQAARFLAEHQFRHENSPRQMRPRLYVRVNGLESGRTADDLSAVVPWAPDALVLPKPLSGACVSRFAEAVEAEERRVSPPRAPIPVIAIATETARALLAMGTFVDCSPRLAGLAWGAEDLSAALGATACHDEGGALTGPYKMARDLCLIAAHAAQALAIDGIHVNFRDLDGLDREAREAARDGFCAKLAIHPGQIPVINRAFTPTAEAVAEAEAIVDAFSSLGDPGVVSWRGRMLDRPHLLQARHLLARARLFSPRR